mmetsp:Transcript_6695/g.18014  ORF Transcript_6695/g.18014 Transcript_6695/m.18014 type:complete len:207 (-) Transcript_6695:404-1024(-)
MLQVLRRPGRATRKGLRRQEQEGATSLRARLRTASVCVLRHLLHEVHRAGRRPRQGLRRQGRSVARGRQRRRRRRRRRRDDPAGSGGAAAGPAGGVARRGRHGHARGVGRRHPDARAAGGHAASGRPKARVRWPGQRISRGRRGGGGPRPVQRRALQLLHVPDLRHDARRPAPPGARRRAAAGGAGGPAGGLGAPGRVGGGPAGHR